jgi:hypothetical protein
MFASFLASPENDLSASGSRTGQAKLRKRYPVEIC